MGKISFAIESAKIIDEDPTGQFSIAEIHAFSSGENLHDMVCDIDVLKRTAYTLYEKPLVFDYSDTFGDFGGHIESPLIAGFVVKDSAKFNQLEDGRVGLFVKAKIWKLYSGNFIKVFEQERRNTKKVSVEMELLEVEEPKNGGKFAKMVDFVYSAICVLGTYFKEASPGANIKILSFSQIEDKEEYLLHSFQRYEDLNFEIPKSVKKNSERGLKLSDEFGIGGNSVSKSVAKYIINNKVANPDRVRQIAKFFSRELKLDLSDKKGSDWITWQQWGGNDAKDWSISLFEQMNVEDSQISVHFQDEEERMPYKSLDDVNPAIKGIDPPVSLSQANEIASQAEAIGVDDEKNGWAIAISKFKENHKVVDGKWVKKENKKKEEAKNNMSFTIEEADAYAKEKFSLNSSQVIQHINKALSEFKSDSGDIIYHAEAFNADVAYVYNSETGERFSMPYDLDNDVVSIEEDKKEFVTLDSFEIFQLHGDEPKEDDEPELEPEDDEPGENGDMSANSYERVEEAIELLSSDEDVDDDGETMMQQYASGKLTVQEIFSKMVDAIKEASDKLNTFSNQISELETFKKDIQQKEFNLAVETALKEVTGIIPDDKVVELREQAKNDFSLDTIDAWKNIVHSIGFEHIAKDKGDEPEIKEIHVGGVEVFGIPVYSQDKSQSIWKN